MESFLPVSSLGLFYNVVIESPFSTGANAGGIIFPLILPPLISRFGLMQTTRIYAVALALCMVPALLFMKARLPESRVHGPAPRASTNNMWLKDRRFWFFMTINTIQGLGHFVPLIWLPSAYTVSAILLIN